VELERDAATKLAYFLCLLRPHLPPEDRFTAESCHFVTVSVIAAVHVVRCPAQCLLRQLMRVLHTTLVHHGVSNCLQTLLELMSAVCSPLTEACG